jgi:hypothetical protein
MKYIFSVNGQIGLTLQPESELEKQLLKALASQDNVFTEISKGAAAGAAYADGTIIIKGSGSKKEAM